MSKFKVGDKIKHIVDGNVFTIKYAVKGAYYFEERSRHNIWSDVIINYEYELVKSSDSDSDTSVYKLPDGYAIDEAVAKVEIRKEMNIKEFFQPVAHKSVWAIKQPKERVK